MVLTESPLQGRNTYWWLNWAKLTLHLQAANRFFPHSPWFPAKKHGSTNTQLNYSWNLLGRRTTRVCTVVFALSCLQSGCQISGPWAPEARVLPPDGCVPELGAFPGMEMGFVFHKVCFPFFYTQQVQTDYMNNPPNETCWRVFAYFLHQACLLQRLGNPCGTTAQEDSRQLSTMLLQGLGFREKCGEWGMCFWYGWSPNR